MDTYDAGAMTLGGSGERATAWAALGWPVFPCSPADKRPLIDAWQKQATTDQERIRAWWKEYPEAVSGVVPGLAGCFAIDVDVKDGKQGVASLATLETQYGFEAWEIPQQQTRSGGLHLFFKGTAKTSAGLLGDGLDTRGGSADGGLGYVIAYSDPFGGPDQCPDAPAALVTALGTIRERDDDTTTARVELDLPANVRRADAFLRGHPVPAPGERNNTLFKIAARLKDLGISMAMAFDLIEAYPSVAGGLIEENKTEFNETVRSAYRNGQLQPGVQAINEDAKSAAAAGYDAGPVGASIEPREGEKGEKKPRARRRQKWGERASRPSPPWIVRGLLAKHSLVAIVGPGGSYKSFTAIDLAASVAAGHGQWAGRDIVNGGPVVYVSGEGHIDGRIRGWATEHPDADISDRLVIQDGIDLGSAEDLADLIEDDEWGGQGPALIVIDTLATAIPGMEENSARDMGRVVEACRTMIRRWGCSVLLVHHTKKDGQGWRGSSAVWNATDLVLDVRRKGRNVATMSVVRSKDAEVGASWGIALAAVETGVEREGEPERTLVVREIAPKVKTDAAGTAEEKQERITRQVAQAEIAIDERRRQVALEVIEKTPPGHDIGYQLLAKQMCAVLGANAGRENVSRFVRRVLTRSGHLNDAHPLAEYVTERKPLTFQNPCKH